MHMVGINSICTFVDSVYNGNINCTRVFLHPSFGYIRSLPLLRSKCENPIPPMTCDFLMFRLMIMFASCFKWVKPKGGGDIPKIGGHNLDLQNLKELKHHSSFSLQGFVSWKFLPIWQLWKGGREHLDVKRLH